MGRMKLKFCIVLIMGLLFSTEMKCQEVAIKTNLLYDALMNVNAGVEVGLAPKWTLDVSGDYNGWKFSHQRQWKHWMVQPEARYWFCDRFQGWFLGVHAHGGQYNVGGGLDNSIDFFGTDLSPLGENRVQGWFVGAGVGAGYAVALSKHFNLEFELGIGYAYTKFDKYRCTTCDSKIESDKDHHYFGPTKAEIGFVYLF